MYPFWLLFFKDKFGDWESPTVEQFMISVKTLTLQGYCELAFATFYSKTHWSVCSYVYLVNSNNTIHAQSGNGGLQTYD